MAYVVGKGILLTNPAGDTSIYKKVNVPNLAPARLANLAGEYNSTEADAAFTITIKNNEVIYWRAPDIEVKLKPVFQDAFIDDDYWLYEFTRDKKGNVTGAYISLSRAERVAFLKIK